MLLAALAGLWAYNGLGREEDPPFTIKTMVIKTNWPGATATDTLAQITDRIEKKLEELPNLDFVRSYTKPGDSVVFVNLKDTVVGQAVQPLWYQVRKKIDDIKSTLPSGISGPYYNDEFGDTYSLIYALTSPDLTHRELRDLADGLRAELLRVKDVAKVDLVGVLDEKVYLEFSTLQMAALGIDPSTIVQALQAQNALVPSGTVDAGPERIAIRVSGEFTSEKSLKEINFYSNNRFFRLSDVAEVKRAHVDPPQPMFRFNGEPAIGLAIVMTIGGDALALGKNVKDRAAGLVGELPIGVDMHLVADQPHVVKEAVGEFTKSLMEADFDRTGRELSRARMAAGDRGGYRNSTGIGDYLRDDEIRGHLVATHLARRFDYRAWPVSRRRDDRSRNDDHQNGRRLRSHQSRDLCLHLHRLPDADWNTGDDRRFRARRFCQQRGGRILLFAVRRRRHCTDCVVAGRGAVHATDRRCDPAQGN